MNYGEVLSRSWSNFWQHRLTWLLGILAAVLAGFVPSLVSAVSALEPLGLDQSDPTAIFEGLKFVQWLQDNLAFLIVLGVALLLFAIALSLLSLVFTGALIAASGRIEEGERIGFKESLRLGAARFWPFFGLVMLIGVAMVAFILVLMTPLIVGIIAGESSDASWGLALIFVSLGLMFLLLLPVIVLAYLVQELAVRSIIIGGRGVFSSISFAFDIIRTQFGRVLLLGLIVFGITIGAFIAFTIVSLPLSAPSLILNFALIKEPYTASSFLIVGLVAFVGTWISTSLPGVISAYVAAYWTAAYKRLGGPMS